MKSNALLKSDPLFFYWFFYKEIHVFCEHNVYYNNKIVRDNKRWIQLPRTSWLTKAKQTLFQQKMSAIALIQEITVRTKYVNMKESFHKTFQYYYIWINTDVTRIVKKNKSNSIKYTQESAKNNVKK